MTFTERLFCHWPLAHTPFKLRVGWGVVTDTIRNREGGKTMTYDGSSGRGNFDRYVARAQAQWGDRLDLSEIPAKFIPYFQTGRRIKVRMYGQEVTGTVSITTGWRPALLLMRRSSSHGSSDLLSGDVEVIAVQHGRTYVPVGNLYRNPNDVHGSVQVGA